MALPIVDTEYLKQIDKARRDLRAFISNKNCAPIMLRLAWHDAGTYDATTKTGGANGSIRMEEEYSHGSNNGLKIAIDFCEEIKHKCPKITYADLYQLAGVVAVEVTGGPTVDFVPGRKDEDAFFRDYAVSHKKLSELGFTPHSGSKTTVKDSTILAHSAVGVAKAAADDLDTAFFKKLDGFQRCELNELKAGSHVFAVYDDNFFKSTSYTTEVCAANFKEENEDLRAVESQILTKKAELSKFESEYREVQTDFTEMASKYTQEMQAVKHEHISNSLGNRRRGTVILAVICFTGEVVLAADKQETWTSKTKTKKAFCNKIYVTNRNLAISACGDSDFAVAVMDRFKREAANCTQASDGLSRLQKMIADEASVYSRRQFRRRHLSGSIFVLAGFQRGLPNIQTCWATWEARSNVTVHTGNHHTYASLGSGAAIAERIIQTKSESLHKLPFEELCGLLNNAIFHAARNDVNCGFGTDMVILRYGRRLQRKRITGVTFQKSLEDARDILYVSDGVGGSITPISRTPIDLTKSDEKKIQPTVQPKHVYF